MSGTVTTGWHSDPFGLHEARYFSADGQPTKLVRDRGLESYDAPPSAPDEVAAAMARMSAMPEPSDGSWSRDPYPRDPYPRARAAARDPRRPSARFAASLIVATAAAGAIYLVAQPLLRSPKPSSTSSTSSTSSAPGGLTDVAFVTQAATRTLQQRTASLVFSATTSAGAAGYTAQGNGSFDLGGNAGTMSLTLNSKADKITVQEILVNDYAYIGMSINGQSLMPPGKAWVAEQAPATQGSGTDLNGGNPTDALAALENQGIKVTAIGTKDIRGVSCTGYAVTPPGAQAAITVWISPDHLMREITENATFGLSMSGASATAPPTGPASSLSMNLTMDFTYSAAPLQVTAPPAASTISLGAWLQQLMSSPALKQLESSSGPI